MIGCPVEAYTKDPLTGVVLHNADTCIGCQYCTWNCSYGVPQYNAERGVVGKCDLCHNRLERRHGSRVRSACPEGAISVEIVNVARVARRTSRSPTLPACHPRTTASRRRASRSRENLLPDTGRVDTQRIAPEHPHWPLVFMLVLTQLAAGAFATLAVLDALERRSGPGRVSAGLTRAWRHEPRRFAPCTSGGPSTHGVRCEDSAPRG